MQTAVQNQLLPSIMACVKAIPVPDSMQKVDELFLFWLSESSTQEMLRKELSKVCGGAREFEEDSPIQIQPSSSSVTNVRRPGSPTVRTPSPPPLLSRSPKSPRAKLRPKSPLGVSNLTHVNAQSQRPGVVTGDRPLKQEEDGSSSHLHAVEEVDVPRSQGQEDQDESQFQVQDDAPASPSSAKQPVQARTDADILERQGHSQSGADAAARSVPPPSELIPRFYFPNGQPQPEENVEQRLKDVGQVFQRHPKGEIPQSEFHAVTKAMGLPLYWKAPLFKACVGKNQGRKTVSYPAFKRTWLRITHNCHDNAARFVQMLAGSGRNYLTEEDFDTLLQDIVDTHPGLAFLASAPEFHVRYIETVIGRIFYVLDKNWSGRITAADLRRSNFLQVLKLLEDVSDINQVLDYFSYEHFYVIYCKFWELDTDHDLLIDAQDFARLTGHALTPRIIQRILSGVVTRDKETPAGKLSYKDFIWFLLSEEDKTTPRSTEYWFRCMDLDGDGVLSLYELEYFYQEVLQRLQELNIECLSVENALCQILDMVNPKEQGKITLRDLKTCKMTPVFFNTFVNVEKYLEYEQRDPVAAAKDDGETAGLSEWDRYAAEHYEILLAEEAYEQENDFEEEENDSDLGEDEKEMLDLLR